MKTCKLRNFSLIAFIVILAIILTACNRGGSQSTASNTVQTQIIDIEEGFSSGPSYRTSSKRIDVTAVLILRRDKG